MLFAPINSATASTITVVSAMAGKKIRVCNYVIVAGGSCNPYFATSTGTTKLTGAFPLAAQAGVSSGPAPESMGMSQGHFETNTGDSLQIVLDQSVQISGHLSYLYVN